MPNIIDTSVYPSRIQPNDGPNGAPPNSLPGLPQIGQIFNHIPNPFASFVQPPPPQQTGAGQPYFQTNAAQFPMNIPSMAGASTGSPFPSASTSASGIPYNPYATNATVPTASVTNYDGSPLGNRNSVPPGGVPPMRTAARTDGNVRVGTGIPLGGGANGATDNSPLGLAHAKLDSVLGQGWSDQFQMAHGESPVEFYAKAFPHIRDNQARADAAVNAAINDAKFQARAIPEWQKVHGNVPVPPEQWARWWKMAQGGGADYGGGAGVNPFGCTSQ